MMGSFLCLRLRGYKMKKRILITHWSMVMGGIEIALINLLNRLNPDQYEIDLLLETKTGEFLYRVPQYVNIIDAESVGVLCSSKRMLFRELRHFRLISACKLVYYYLRKRRDKMYEIHFRNLRQLNYDIAICYSPSLMLMQLVNNHVEAPIKMYFMHNKPFIDNKKTNDGPGYSNMALRGKYLKNYSYICGVSNSITDKLKELFPQYAEKCITIYNYIDVEEIVNKSTQFVATEMTDDRHSVKILSVGRFVSEKNFTVIPSVCELLVKQRLKVKWYVIGDGNEFEKTQNLILEKHLEDRVFLLGAKDNPYPYFKACDIYCQPSLTEAYCITACEARILNKIIVATDFPAIREQLQNGLGGIIVKNEPNYIAEGIEKVIAMGAEEKKDMLAYAQYPNNLEQATQNKFFEIINSLE